MKKLAIIGASYLQLPLILKAKDMGYETHVFAWAAGDVGEKAADFFYPISITEINEIGEKCAEIGIDGICSIASDLAAITVNEVAFRLGLTGNSPECTRRSTNKHLMRQAFLRGGDPCPRSRLAVPGADPAELLRDFSFPLIVKPTDRSGSRGITKISRAEELPAALEAAWTCGFEKKAMVEEFAEGVEYSVEYMSWQGEHHFLAMTRKYTTGDPHFIETGHLQPAPVDPETLYRTKAIVRHALDTLGIENGASHSEVKIDDQGRILIIEIGGRMGGDCIGSDLVPLSTGIDYVRAVIDAAVGHAPDLRPLYDPPRRAEVRYILTEADLREYEALRRAHPEQIFRAEEIHPELLGRATDSSTRAGCYLMGQR